MFLDKTEQRSDWTRRPLTESQLAYAAVDVLLELHDRLAPLLAGSHPLHDEP